MGVTSGTWCANSIFCLSIIIVHKALAWRKYAAFFFFLIKTHFACLQTVFNYFWSFSVFLLLLFYVGSIWRLLVYLRGVGLLSFHASFYSGRWGKCLVGLMSYTRIPVGWTGGSPFSHPFSPFSHPSSPFLPPLLISFLPAIFLFLPPPLPFLPSILSFLPPPLSFLSAPFSLNPVRPLHSVTGLFAQKPVPPGTIRTNGFFLTGTINPGRFAQMVKMWNKKFLIENFKLQ